MSYTYQIEYCCVNIKGGVREQNQDNFYAGGRYRLRDEKDNDIVVTGHIRSEDNGILAVYDGMGGESHGDIASFIAASNTSAFDKLKSSDKSFLSEMCRRLNSEVCRFGAQNNIVCMGTTAAILRFESTDIIACNLGDSRIFKIDGSHIAQISKDHVLRGIPGIKPPLTQYLGIPAEECDIEPYILSLPYTDNDMYLICSDGITDMLTDNDIFTTVQSKNDIAQIAKQLVSCALKNGGHDNITAILCRVNKIKRNVLIGRICKKITSQRSI